MGLPGRGRVFSRPITKSQRRSSRHFSYRMKHVCRLAAPNKCRERQQGVLVMPQYSSLTDGEIARLATDLRRTRTKLPPWSDLAPRVGGIAVTESEKRS